MPHEATTVCAHDPIAESGTARAFPRAAELKRSGSGVICARFTASGNERARRVITHGLQVRYRAHTVGTSSCTTSPAAASHLAARRMGAPGRYSRDRRTRAASSTQQIRPGGQKRAAVALLDLRGVQPHQPAARQLSTSRQRPAAPMSQRSTAPITRGAACSSGPGAQRGRVLLPGPLDHDREKHP